MVDMDMMDMRGALGFLSSTTSTVVTATTICNLTVTGNQTDGSGDGRGTGAGSGGGTLAEDGEEDDMDALSPLAMSCLGVFLSIVIFLSVAGNILVCIAIYTERSLRRIGNLFLASLAIADLFVASLVMTFAGVNDLLGYWIFGAQFCDTWVAFDVMCSTASILNLCAISLDRYIHIKDPLRYGRWVTRRVAIGTIVVIWLLAALVSFVPISLDLHRDKRDETDTSLIINGVKYETCALDLTPTYAVVSSCISFYVPCIVMIGIYCRLYCYAQKHVKSIRAVTRPGEISEKRYRSIRKPKANKNKLKLRQLAHTASSPYHVSDHKAAITVGVIMGVFLVCWVPFFCVNIIAAFCKTCIGGQTFKVLSWLGYSNSAFNPIIYSIFNTEFRAAFKRILTTRSAWCCGQEMGNIYPRHSDRNKQYPVKSISQSTDIANIDLEQNKNDNNITKSIFLLIKN
ncbi:dopamine receptor 1 isoform X3 [Uranotaenia lowii]|uniref:dopamine receptor 1 isoform X3 n=1 Tax=Uranotaenia lowii TaxID=190385 RepID=UPI00247A8032|nr:dopamine receptor 1 isoform X3 [Uranotaenia lowii]